MAAADVLHVAGWYAPYQVGGTEVYVEGLVAELQRLDIASTVLVPRAPGAPETYVHAGLPVETYPVNVEPTAGELRYSETHRDFDIFRARLAKHRGDIYHQHSWTRGCGLHHLLAARELGMRTVVTVHVPSNLCLRGTMRRFGAMACDGRVVAKTCGACWAEGQGLARPIAQAIANLPLAAARFACTSDLRIGTALAARALGADKGVQLRRMLEAADRIVAVCDWVYRALQLNGAPAAKLSLSRQGISRGLDEALAQSAEAKRAFDPVLKLLYLGSFTPIKGIEHAVGAVRALPESVQVSLTIHAPSSSSHEQEGYERRLRELAGDDERIRFAGPVAREALAEALNRHDALVVPSVWLETGPLVVLEAQAAGLYVLGSGLGGIAELVTENGGGELIEAGNTIAWAEAIQRLARDHAELRGAARRRRPVRTMGHAAADMADLYASL